ncbi:MAG: hypothetical protein ACRC7N_14355 [Clostridium sp.]
MTPLTGPSDLGKSTVLKAMYFAIKICNEYENEKKNWLKQIENMNHEEILSKFDIVTSRGNSNILRDELILSAIDKLTKKFVNSVYSAIFDFLNENTVIELFIYLTLKY